MITVIVSPQVCRDPHMRVPATGGEGMTRRAVLGDWVATVRADRGSEMSQTEKKAYINQVSVWLAAVADQRWAVGAAGGALATAMAKETGHPIGTDERAALQFAVEAYVHDLARYCALHKLVAKECLPGGRGALGQSVKLRLAGVTRSQAVTAVSEELQYGIPNEEFLGNGGSVLRFVECCRGADGSSPVRVTDGATEFRGLQVPPEDEVARRACVGEVLFHVEKLLAELAPFADAAEETVLESTVSKLADVPVLEAMGEALADSIGRGFPGLEQARRRAVARLDTVLLSKNPKAAIAGVESEYDVVTAIIEKLASLEFRGRPEPDEHSIARMYFARISGDKRRRLYRNSTGSGASKRTDGPSPAGSDRDPVDRVSKNEAASIDPTAESVVGEDAGGGLASRAATYLRASVSDGGLGRTFELDIAIAILDGGDAVAADAVSGREDLEVAFDKAVEAAGPGRSVRVGMDRESTLDLVREYLSDGIRWVYEQEREEGEE